MRYDPSVCTWRRRAAKASTIAGVEIPAGADLLLMLHSANRDPAVFPEPDLIITSRDNLKDHLAFGYGIHYCVGAPLARLEMAILLETLTGALPNMRLVPDQSACSTRAISHSAVPPRSGSPGEAQTIPCFTVGLYNGSPRPHKG